MAVKIRLARAGRHELPFYRIVAADSRYSKDGRYLEQIGTYDPKKGIKDGVVLKEDIAIKWLKLGAQPSDTVKALLKEKDVFEKAKKGE